MDRRGFLKSILAAGVAPAFVGSSVLMPVRKILSAEPVLFVPSGTGATPKTIQDALWAADAVLYGDGIHDDAPALQAFLDGKNVVRADGQKFNGILGSQRFRIERTIHITRDFQGALYGGTLVGAMRGTEPMIHIAADAWNERKGSAINNISLFDGRSLVLRQFDES